MIAAWLLKNTEQNAPDPACAFLGLINTQAQVRPSSPWASCGALMILVLGLWGCGPGGLEGTIPISGRVTYQGQPLTVGEVRYLPVDTDQGRMARGKLQSDGRFQLTTLKTGDGALPGKYRVVVVVFPEEGAKSATDRLSNKQQPGGPQQPPIPLKYYRPESSGLTDQVDANHPGHREFELD